VQGIILTQYTLQAVFGPNHTIRTQMPMDLGQSSDPEPDVVVVPGGPRAQPRHHPTTALLVVEVADTSLDYDTTTKAELYAAAGTADDWVLDLTGRRRLVFRDPAPIVAGGTAYHTHHTHGPADSVAPLAAPNSPVRVADLLP
ncbi:MAG TPA: Uma2 family endonuclease, partial [Gemmataceae bacterium]|nr:Uma2 family endonuclease [Gemmataceae bacterium]